MGWDGENPTVGGVKIKPLEIKNGVAYVDKNDVDSVLGDIEKNAGIKGAQKSREENFGKVESDALNALITQKPFSYEVETDPVYQAYKKQYEREAEMASRRVLNDNNTSVTGASGAVLSEAIAAHDAELDKITDMIPELYENAYKRYKDENDVLSGNLKTINDVANDYYDRVYKSDSDKINRIVQAAAEERKERNNQLEYEIEKEKEIRETALDEIQLGLKVNQTNSNITKAEVSAEKTAMENALSRGFFVESDEKAIPWLKDYRTGDGQYSILPSVAIIAYEYEAAAARERGKIDGQFSQWGG